MVEKICPVPTQKPLGKLSRVWIEERTSVARVLVFPFEVLSPNALDSRSMFAPNQPSGFSHKCKTRLIESASGTCIFSEEGMIWKDTQICHQRPDDLCWQMIFPGIWLWGCRKKLAYYGMSWATFWHFLIVVQTSALFCWKSGLEWSQIPRSKHPGVSARQIFSHLGCILTVMTPHLLKQIVHFICIWLGSFDLSFACFSLAEAFKVLSVVII